MKRMETQAITLKGALATFFAMVSARFGLLVPVTGFLAILMVGDWISGTMASGYEKIKYPNAPDKGLSSSKGAQGIFKKVSYLLAVGVGIGLDWLILTMAEEFDMVIPLKAFFGLLIALWYVVNEMLSIIENLNRMDAHIPSWLVKAVKFLQCKIDDAGENATPDNEDEENGQ